MIKSKEEIIALSKQFAEAVWDETGLPEEDRSTAGVLNLCKACGSLGYSSGYENAIKYVLELQKAVWEAARQQNLYGACSGHAVNGNKYQWITFEEWLKENE